MVSPGVLEIFCKSFLASPPREIDHQDITPDEETDSKTESLQCKINIQVLISLKATFPTETLNIEREVKKPLISPRVSKVEGHVSAFGTSG